MALSKEVYEVFEDIVGPEYISDDPAILDTYAFQWPAELIHPQQKRFMSVRPEAVLLPGSTEEVQAIAKACNRYGVKFKPLGRGWLATNAPHIEGVVQLDMVRMNRILEIDEKNMYAVIEPYVTAGELQAEAMKRGLNCYMIGAGGNCSVIANSACCLGVSPHGIYMGNGAENLLSAEWVMPNGDVLRTGSAGSGLGWFCSEGPGPSTRGILRGWFGGLGGWGVVTKIGVRLHPWPGPSEMPIVGTVPAYSTQLPDNFKAYTVKFPSEQRFADAVNKIYDAQIGYVVHRQFNFYGDEVQAAMVNIFKDPTKSLDNLEEMVARPEIQQLNEEMKCAFQVVLAGNSTGDVAWQDRALDEILAETEGRKVAAMSEPDMEQFTLMFLLRLPTKNTNFLYTGSFVGLYGPCVAPDYAVPTVEAGTNLKRVFIEKGGIANDGANSFMGTMACIGGGGNLYQEQFYFHDPSDPDSVRAGLETLLAGSGDSHERGWPPTYSGVLIGAVLPDMMRDPMLMREAQPRMYQWQRKIHHAFDPKDAGGGGFLWLQEPEE